MIDFQSFSITLAALSFVVAAVYYVLTLRNNQRAQQQQLETRQAQLFMDIYKHHSSKEHHEDLVELLNWEWDDNDDFYEKYGDWNVQFLSYLSNLEGLGLLVRYGLLDSNRVYDLQYASIIRAWEKFLPVILEARDRLSAPQLWTTIEFLYDEMVRIRAERSHEEIGFAYAKKPM